MPKLSGPAVPLSHRTKFRGEVAQRLSFAKQDFIQEPFFLLFPL